MESEHTNGKRPAPMVERGMVQFGRHAGNKVEDVPSEYLVWFCNKLRNDMEARRAWAKMELKRRGTRVSR